MIKDDLVYLEALVMNEIITRRKLGGYSMEAEGMLTLSVVLFRLVEHMVETCPQPKKAKKNEAPVKLRPRRK